jgi:ParB family chromosome partitioning protein
MQITHIAPSSIVVLERQRAGYPNLGDLVDSLQRYGLIQPIVVNTKNELIAGGRRLAAAKELKWETVPVVTRETLNDADLAELELEENVRREQLSWQERCLAIAGIHEKRKTNAALHSDTWFMEHTGALLDMTKSNVWYALKIADLLKAKDEEAWTQPNLWGAMQLLVARKARQAEAMIVRAVPPRAVADGEADDTVDDVDSLFVHTYPAPGSTFGRNYTLVHGDAIEWLAKQPDASIDHIYSDPPYAIDMANLQQENVGMNVEDVAAEHQVEPNMDLLAQFLSLAYVKTKETSFVVFWCDQDRWQFLKDTAEAAGFRVQRWPLIWTKIHNCQNTQAYKNFTKAAEIAMLCAKSQATLAQLRRENYWLGDFKVGEPNKTHPFWKPLAMHQWIISAIATPGSTIVDPFAGAGSIPLAAVRAGFSAIGVEKVDQHFVQLEQNLKQ